MSLPHSRSRPLARALCLLSLSAGVSFGLACGGLPIPGGDGDAPKENTPVAAEEGEEGEEDGEGAAAADTGKEDGEPAGEKGAAGGIEGQFAALDPDEAPPFERSAIQCPEGTSPIRHPKGSVLSVYCATGSGVRSGPYTEWRGSRLVVAATNVDGKLDGRWTRWERVDSNLRKVEEQSYVAGVAQGDHAEWDVQGRLRVRGRMVDGKRHGRFIEREASGSELAPGGACYQAGEVLWRTGDEGELASKPCEGDAVAEG